MRVTDDLLVPQALDKPSKGSKGVRARTPAQLLEAAKRHAAERERRKAERAAAERARRERAEAAARERYLVRLAKREAQTWRHVEALVATRKQSDYDEAVRLLKDLKDLASRQGAGRRGASTHS